MSRRFSIRFTAFALSTLVTLATMGSVGLLATSPPPAGLVAQMAHSPAHV